MLLDNGTRLNGVHSPGENLRGEPKQAGGIKDVDRLFADVLVGSPSGMPAMALSPATPDR